ncbi:MAG: CBS domain-containing protein [Actinomycetia bacterium]|nr:CBS domain-containing protein [Actinomycetes bacterium]
MNNRTIQLKGSPTGRLLYLVILAVVVGMVAGGAAYLLVRGIGVITGLALLGEWSWGEIPPLSDLEPSPRLVIAAVIGALIVATIARWEPLIRGHGIPEAMEAVLRRQSRIRPRAGLAKPVSAAIAIGTGGPFGAEGPIIVTGGAIGSLMGQIIKVTPGERKILLASGAAAGMAATFGAPLASVLLAIELLLFELSIRSLIPLVVAASVAGGIHAAIFGEGPLFSAPDHDYAGLGALPLYAVLGIASGGMAIIIARGLFASERLFQRSPIPVFFQPATGAVVFASIGLFVPRVLGVGYDVIDDVLDAKLGLGTLAVVVVAKLVAWWVALGSGTSGGTLAPILLIGATFGGLFAAVILEFFPGIGISQGAFAVVAMAAVFGAATRAPFTAIVFVFELTRDFEVILPLMLASVLAALVYSALSSDSIYTERLSRRGIRVGGELVADPLRTTAVSDVMNRMVDTVEPTDPTGEVADRIARGERGAFPLVDESGRCIGIISRRDLLAQSISRDQPVGELASSDVVGIAPDASLLEALQTMVDENINHLPVLENDLLVGICTRADIVRVRSDELALERLEAGWLAPVLQRRNAAELRYLVVGYQSLGSKALMTEIEAMVEQPSPISFHVVVPLPRGDDLTEARATLENQLHLIEQLGVSASGEIGADDPFVAIEQTVGRAPVHSIILSTLPPRRSRWLHGDLVTRIRRRIEVDCVVVHDDE